jgi:quinoprotein glucose dehydrogenase
LKPVMAPKLIAVLLGLCGLVLLGAGGYLVSLGGSPYYVITGLALLTSAALFWKNDVRALWIFTATLVGTLVWATWECGFAAWPLLPRLAWIFVLGLCVAVPSVRRSVGPNDRVAKAFPAVLVALALIVVAGVLVQSLRPAAARAVRVTAPSHTTSPDDGSWLAYGRDPGGSRFSPLAQITTANVSSLKQVWSYHAPLDAPSDITFETTPLEVDGRLYLCAGGSHVIALDAEDGHQIWQFSPTVDLHGVYVNTCRGVAYFKASDDRAPCAKRIFTTTPDLRLMALDADTGALCPAFGDKGVVDLGKGLGDVNPGIAQVTSAPQIVRGKIVVGGKISDNRSTDVPSGVIRAFDAVTGALAWAWDMGASEGAASDIYTRSTPNSWAPVSADEELGLVYLPMGNPSPDYFGGLRRPFDERYGDAVVALDAETGKVRWSFQTTHHDLWDYDVPAQPTLVNLADGTKAVVVTTKRGEVFLLDRLTGNPIATVEERAVAHDGVPGEHMAPTQPFSAGMPSFAGPAPSEQRMWGITIFDQLWCRIKFREARFDGTMTPLGTGHFSVIWPGFMGGSNWGGVALDADRGLMIVNANNVSNYDRLLTRADFDKLDLQHARSRTAAARYSAQRGTPYAVDAQPFLSPLDIPCTQPPYGTIAAVDLNTRQLVWSKPFGTTAGSGPLDVPLGLPLPMGVPNLGGAVVTRGGIFFIGASQDGFFRAFETATGRELWRTQLPAGGQATPMTYWSAKSGRQFVVIAAGGHAGIRAKHGDQLIAFALPADKER